MIQKQPFDHGKEDRAEPRIVSEGEDVNKPSDLDPDPMVPDIAQDAQQEAPKGWKERMYDKVKLPLWALDVIIALLVLALAVSIYLGTR